VVKDSGKKIHYFPHPVKNRRPEKNHEKEYDLLIWGTISPYKGIDKFLEYIYQNKLEFRYNILIVGKITTDDYRKKLENYKSKNILIEDKFIEDTLLQELISKSKLVLFTYSQSSILSSGVLMDSLGYGANIIGPNVGAFADLANEGIINTYSDFPSMFKIIDEQLNDKGKKIDKEKIDRFLEDNSWNKFAENVCKLLNSVK
jgi:glycosyltransferase involved in cell wall biosynthesis